MDGASESTGGGDTGNSKPCPRCGLYYEQENIECHHCTGLSEQEALEHGKGVTKSLAKYTNPIAKLFFYLACIIVLIVVFMLLSHDKSF